jgi:hypothetical protein
MLDANFAKLDIKETNDGDEDTDDESSGDIINLDLKKNAKQENEE